MLDAEMLEAAFDETLEQQAFEAGQKPSEGRFERKVSEFEVPEGI